jgi:hypothetical protein
MLAALGAGAVLGSVLGATTSTTIKPPPEPPWRHAARSEDAHAQVADPAPPDFNAYRSATDRAPTWKRHRSEYQQGDYPLPQMAGPAAHQPLETRAPQTQATVPGVVAEPPAGSPNSAQAGA